MATQGIDSVVIVESEDAILVTLKMTKNLKHLVEKIKIDNQKF